jgi:ADP-ribosylglycohydrolase
MSSAETPSRIDAVRNSALWAAYGDALGFISELAPTPAVLGRRIGRDRVDALQPWRRRIGGKFGVELELPRGTYSDDTQLRLATSRAIRTSGRFDVEAFSKIELPVFLAYELGCGRSTRAAASELTKRAVRWSNNFFEMDNARYVDGGGNGAAMRIQPHVWASPNLEPATFLGDVFINSVCTHGHARGFVGAAWHAVALAHALERHDLPNLDDLERLLGLLGQLPEIVRGLPLIGELWLPVWEQRSARQLEEAVAQVIDEGRGDIERIRPLVEANGSTYPRVVEELGGLDNETRGSGMKSALFSSVAAWLFRDRPADGSLECVNVLGSDTDTIASMAGALLGGVTKEPPPQAIADSDYIISEAQRVARTGGGEVLDDFPYPDLLKWAPPKTQLDTVGAYDGGLAVAGLGPAVEASEATPAKGRDKAVWQWLELGFGQRVLVRRRERARNLSPELVPGAGRRVRDGDASDSPRLFEAEATRVRPPTSPQRLDLDSATQRVIASDFDPRLIGQLLLTFAEGEGGVDFAVAFAAIVAKARAARQRRTGARNARDGGDAGRK